MKTNPWHINIQANLIDKEFNGLEFTAMKHKPSYTESHSALMKRAPIKEKKGTHDLQFFPNASGLGGSSDR